MSRQSSPTIPPEFAIGKKVLVQGHEDQGPRTIVEHYDQTVYNGGVRLDRPVPFNDIFVSWNIDALTPVEETP